MVMSEVQSVSLPNLKVAGSSKRGRIIFSAAVLLLGAIIIAFVLWLAQGRVVSVQAAADGMVYTIAPEISAKLLDLQVQAGSFVEKGQVVAHHANDQSY